VTRAVAILALSLAAGCYSRTYVLDDPDAASRRDAGSPPLDAEPDGGRVWVEPTAECTEPAGVDLLFVVDGSNSMTEEQDSLAAALPALVTSLVMPPDLDGDGEPDWLPVPSLHVGVVTPDMGSGGHDAPTCGGGTLGLDFGDDGLLLTRSGPRPGCAPTYPSIFRFMGGDDPIAFTNDVACVTTVGVGGCGFEQQLEAMLKALSPAAPTAYTSASYVPPIFFRDTLPHGDRENAGFVRDDTLLAVIMVTDEEDCSARDPSLFDPRSPRFDPNLNLRCFSYPETLHPIERYVEGLLALRIQRPDLVAFGLVAGIPVDAPHPPLPTRADYDAILAHPAMQEMIDPGDPTRLRPSCDVVGRGEAYPPRRLVRVAASLGQGRATVQSI
jgi:hypothetical protein